MSDNGFKKYWIETAHLIASGGNIGNSDLYAICDNLDIENIKPEFLPHKQIVMGTEYCRTEEVYCLTEGLWGMGKNHWREKEKQWLDAEKEQIKEEMQSSGYTYRFDVEDIFFRPVSAEVLIQIVATAKVIKNDKYDRWITYEAVRALNTFLSEVCGRGRARTNFSDGISLFSIFKEGGVSMGTGNKFLPNPQKSLPELILMLEKSKLLPSAYLE